MSPFQTKDERRNEDRALGSSWSEEFDRGQKITTIVGDTVSEFYPRLHSWERELPKSQMATLDESRAHRESLDFIGYQLQRMAGDTRINGYRDKALFEKFDAFILGLEKNANATDPVDLKSILKEMGMVCGPTKLEQILSCVQEKGIHGLTDREGARLAGVDLDSYRTLRLLLKNKGLIVDSGFRRPGPTGRKLVVWVSKDSMGTIASNAGRGEA